VNTRFITLAEFAAELLLWLLPAGAFLAAYVLYFNGPVEAIVPHLKLVGSLGLAWLGLRLLVEHTGLGRVARLLFQLLYSLALTLMLIYYAVILVGLGNWGRVATWHLIKVYLGQWRELVAVLDVPVATVPLGLCLLFAAVLLLVHTVHTRLPWPRQFAAFARLRMSIVLALGALVPFNVMALETYDAIDHRSGEPVMLSLNPGLDTELTEHNQSEGARLLDEREAAAAAAYQPGVLGTPRNVILIVGDALRGDHLSLFRDERETTPYLHSLARAGRFAVAQRIVAACAESYCGLMSIARSKFVHEFSRESLTLQQVLHRHGYRVGLILGGDHTNFYGLSEALGPADLYWDGSMSERYVNDDRAVLERTAELPRWDGTPAFLQFHLMSSHGLGQRQPAFEQFDPARNYYRRLPGADDETRSTWAGNFYDNGLLQFDAVVRELLATLGQHGYLGDAVVIITGDHGEMLGEHGRFAHAASVYRQVLDVPLLMLRFGYAGSDIQARRFASQVDIAPTVLQELGLPAPTSWSGIALQKPATRDFVHFQQGREIGLIDSRDSERAWKFWIDLGSEAYYAFDAGADPNEARNLIADVPARLRSEWMLELLPASNTFGARMLMDPQSAN
jgi:glucan phosphoethanolaminetransferase (alkaline phosphatase superfamily)